MVIGIIGENCSGKSALAEAIRKETGAEVVTGKDYLRMAKNEHEAATLFRAKLESAVSGEDVVYVISEKEQLAILPEGAVRILFSDRCDNSGISGRECRCNRPDYLRQIHCLRTSRSHRTSCLC